MSRASALSAAARRLAEAARTGTPCAPVRDLLSNVDAAYAVQSELIQQQLSAGRLVAGRKIGLTSQAVQRQLGVDTPDFGVLLDDMVFGDREPIDLGSLLQPRVEAEVAFVLGADLEGPGTTVVDVLRATDFVVPAIEVVDSRVAGWDITIVDTVADNASSGVVVLGSTPRRLDEVVLEGMGMVMEHGGDPVSVGAGAACLGSPIMAVVWLAREVARRGRPLRAGEVVLSGALGPMVTVEGPGTYCARLDGLGEVRATFTTNNKEDH